MTDDKKPESREFVLNGFTTYSWGANKRNGKNVFDHTNKMEVTEHSSEHNAIRKEFKRLDLHVIEHSAYLEKCERIKELEAALEKLAEWNMPRGRDFETFVDDINDMKEIARKALKGGG